MDLQYKKSIIISWMRALFCKCSDFYFCGLDCVLMLIEMSIVTIERINDTIR